MKAVPNGVFRFRLRSVPASSRGRLMSEKYDALALFSGGLDSILACKVVQDQGLKVLGLHFVSPFFGFPEKIDHWQMEYGVEVRPVDVSDQYAEMIVNGPENGFGKLLNPCVDCKIMMLKRAKAMLGEFSARMIISGEVTGQRPMSQRRDALNLISKSADVRDVLLRPLCARKLDPTPMELAGLVDRERLLDLGGRGRKVQLRMAGEYGFTDIPSPGGGCQLTEVESSARYYQVLKNVASPTAADFKFCNAGRQYWAGGKWLAIGRNREDNERVAALASETDMAFKVKGFPGPLAVARIRPDTAWEHESVQDAAAFMASFSPKAKKAGGPVTVMVEQGRVVMEVEVVPARDAKLGWKEPDLEGFKEWKADYAG